MKQFTAMSLVRLVGISAVVWAVLAGACLCVGSTGVGWPTWQQVQDRLEPVLLSSLIGAALAAAGVVYQAILRNPLADPYLLGVSSGASLAAYLWRFPAAAAVGATVLGAAGGAVGQQAFAFIGAMLAVAVVFALASRRGKLEPLTLLLVGVIVNAVNGSMFMLVNSISRDMAAQAGGAFTFLVGGIQTNLTTAQKVVPAIAIAAGWLVLLYLAGQLNVAALAESEAQSLGVRIHRLRWVAMVVASAVTASAVAISGPVGFVGLVCPHLGRLMVGTDRRRLLPLATALGGGLLAVADAASRWLLGATFAQTLLPVGVLTGMLGGPFFLLLLYQQRTRAAAEVGR